VFLCLLLCLMRPCLLFCRARIQNHWLKNKLAISSSSTEFQQRETIVKGSSKADWRRQVCLSRKLIAFSHLFSRSSLSLTFGLGLGHVGEAPI
jgi:hypothetical protein